MGMVTYSMAISIFKKKLHPVIAGYTGYQMIIRKDVNYYLADNRRNFMNEYQYLTIGLTSLRNFEKKIIKRDSPFGLYILQACCPDDIDTEDLRKRLLNIFLDSLEEAIELNAKYRISGRQIS